MCINFTFAQLEGEKQIYSSPKLKDEISKHRIVAILPFETAITYKRLPKNYDTSVNNNEQAALSRSLQQSMFTYLLRKSKKYSVEFQDVERSNVLLKSAGVLDHMDMITQDSICKILKVDAVIKSRYTYEKTATEAGAIVKTILFGKTSGAKTGSAALVMQIYNGKDGNLLWRFYKALNDNFTSSTDELVERLMRKVSRNFPYKK